MRTHSESCAIYAGPVYAALPCDCGLAGRAYQTDEEQHDAGIDVPHLLDWAPPCQSEMDFPDISEGSGSE
jgi:hypothetical protein